MFVAKGVLEGEEGRSLRLTGVSFLAGRPSGAHHIRVAWGDGKAPDQFLFGPALSPSTIDADHTYSQDGSYLVTVRVANNAGESATANLTARISNVPPTISAFVPATAILGEPFSVSGSFADPGFDDVHTITITWGDGSSQQATSISESQRTWGAIHVFRQLGSFVVRARITDGLGSDEMIAPVRVIDRPSAPRNVRASAQLAFTEVVWDPPTTDNGGKIIEYLVAADPMMPGGAVSAGPFTSIRLTNLASCTQYTFTVRAVNAAGPSEPSSKSPAVTTLGPPSEPTALSVTAGNTYMSVAWASPGKTCGLLVAGYEIVGTPNIAPASLSSVTFSWLVTGLSKNTTYTISVAARNAYGVGPAVSRVVSTTP